MFELEPCWFLKFHMQIWRCLKFAILSDLFADAWKHCRPFCLYIMAIHHGRNVDQILKHSKKTTDLRWRMKVSRNHDTHQFDPAQLIPPPHTTSMMLLMRNNTCGGTLWRWERHPTRNNGNDDNDDDDEDDDHDASDGSLPTFPSKFSSNHQTCLHKTQLWQHDIYATNEALHRCN